MTQLIIVVLVVVVVVIIVVGGNTTDEEYTFGVLGIPLEVLQEQLRIRVASGSQASTSMSVPSSTSLDKVETMYSCAIGIHSKTDEKRLDSLRS